MNTHHGGLFPASLALGLILSLGVQAQDSQHGHERAASDTEIPLFEGLGEHQFPITTTSETAQEYFDQGLMFIYGFNHFEAVRSFTAAARHDADCAMCHWGIALALGPHINAPMFPDAIAPAHAAQSRAQELAPEATEREQAYIEALSARYAEEPRTDRSELDQAYADAMRELVNAHPDDLDAATLFAESLMNLVPWDYWDENGQPRAETAELVDVLESVLEREPYHPGALHYYIHAMENSPDPERAEGAADRLSELNIQIGHMIHMPSHIYARVGRWHDASVANEGAVAEDEDYLSGHQVEGMIPLLYHPHNFHFLAWTAGMEGRSALAYEAATRLVDATQQELAADLPFLYNFLAMPTLTLVRFEQWDRILALPEPAEDAVFLAGIHHYARGRAHAAQSDEENTSREAHRLSEIAASEEAQALELPQAFFPGASMLAIADNILQAELARLQDDADTAIARLEEAVALQDAMPYFEPPYWFASARLNLGRTLLTLNRAEEAEVVYRKDLEIYPNNGWALAGLAQSLRDQGKTEEAEEVTQHFEEAWQHADQPLVVSQQAE